MSTSAKDVSTELDDPSNCGQLGHTKPSNVKRGSREIPTWDGQGGAEGRLYACPYSCLQASAGAQVPTFNDYSVSSHLLNQPAWQYN